MIAIPNIIGSITSNVFNGHAAYSRNSTGTRTISMKNRVNSKLDYDTDINNRFETSAMYDFIRDYHVTESILTLLKSIIVDLFSDTKIEVTTDNPVRDKVFNHIISKSNLKNKILNNLEDYLFYGSFGMYFDIQTSSFRKLKSQNNIVQYIENDKALFSIVDNNGTAKLLNTFMGYWQLYRPKTIGVLEEECNRNEVYYEKEFVTGTSIFKGAVQRLYAMFIKEYIIDQMSLKEAMKNEILVANVQDPETENDDINEAIDMITNLVNDQESMSLLSNSPESLLALIDNKMINYVNVVPGIQNFTNYDKMDVFSLRDKLQSLRDEIEKDHENALETIGFPKELLMGDSNKQDAFGKSTRLVNLITMINDSILNSIKEFVSNLSLIYFSTELPIGSINLSVNPSEILYNEDINLKFDSFEKKTSALSSIANSYMELHSNEVIDSERLYLYYKSKLAAIDPALAELLIKKTKTDEE